MIGTRLGSYEISAKLGEGGMGEVWRATDTRLERDLALKVLPTAFTEDRDRLARFEREAQLLAQLHHPSIASIFGLEESGGVRALSRAQCEEPPARHRRRADRGGLDESSGDTVVRQARCPRLFRSTRTRPRTEGAPLRLCRCR